jgi:glycosyltransferase involved in cell wall biosynthesis
MTGSDRIRVTHVITGLTVGGAETMLFKLLSELDRERFEPRVISLESPGPVGERIASLGIPTETVAMQPGRVRPRDLRRLGYLLRRPEPAIVQSWLYAADLLAGVLSRIATKARVIWGIRGIIDPAQSKRHEVMTAHACAAVSRWVPHRIVSCSRALKAQHEDLGYARPIDVIPNGFDTSVLRPIPNARADLGATICAPDSDVLVGLPARVNPQKDHATFFRAARLVRESRPDARFVLCGRDVTGDNVALVDLARAAGVEDRTDLLGTWDDMPLFMSAIDVAVSASAYGEGFSNVLGEAMACGTPCVTTDVGDSAWIVGDTGYVVPPRSPRELADTLLEMLALPETERRCLGARARERIATDFELSAVARRFESLYEELAG